MALAKYLETKKEVKKVIHPALTQHPEHEKWKKYFNGASGLFAIEFQDYITQTDVDKLADACKYLELVLPGVDILVFCQL